MVVQIWTKKDSRIQGQQLHLFPAVCKEVGRWIPKSALGRLEENCWTRPLFSVGLFFRPVSSVFGHFFLDGSLASNFIVGAINASLFVVRHCLHYFHVVVTRDSRGDYKHTTTM